MDEMFDLDFSMTMPDDSNTELDKHREDEQSAAAARHMVDEMPAAAVVCGGDHCSVCMEEFRSAGGGGVKQVHCGHVFHENCIFQWLSIRDSCPLCRAKVSSGRVVV